MSVLLHSCCGPCLAGSYPILKLETGEDDVAVFWENPNIHPFVEYHSRLDSLKKMALVYGLKVFYGNTSYGLERFLEALNGKFREKRCEKCYEMRLRAVANAASINGFSSFSTTLLISPYQNHEMLIECGERAAREFEVKFHYSDFRPGFRDSHRIARENELYRQKYCGCIFSEHERYKNDKKFLNPENG